MRLCIGDHLRDVIRLTQRDAKDAHLSHRRTNQMVAWERTNIGIVTALVAILAILGLGWATPASAQTTHAAAAFDQPAMPLADALRRFAKVTGYDVVFQQSLVEGRRSAPVDDARNAHHALSQLLARSGLAPRFTRPDAFILEAEGGDDGADMVLQKIEVVSAADSAAYRWYGEKLLQLCLNTLRRSNEMGLRSYDFTLYVWLTEDGRVRDLQGAGDQGEVIAIAGGMLKGLAVGTVPPANMPQPVGLRITAQ